MQDEVIKRWTTGLEKGLLLLDERHQRRSLGEIQGINLCSNDYLALSEHPQLKEAVVRALQSGTRAGGTGSRLLSGQTESWRELEEEFAKFAETEAALFFSSGYAANTGMLVALVGPDDVVYSDLLNHASLIDGMRLSGARKVIYPHLDLNVLEDRLRKDAGAPWRRIIVTESIFSMNGDVAPLREIADLARKYGAAMIVDEAHATAVHGLAGRGLAAEAGILSQVLATVHACGKALGSAGAFVCGPKIVKEHLINHARTFIFSTALPPYLAEQIRAALRLAMGMEREREILKRRSFAMIRALRCEGFDTANSSSQIVPVMIGTNEDTLKAAAHLQKAGFAVRGIRPPTVPQGQARLRLSLTTKIDEGDLHRLVISLKRWQEQAAVKLVARPA
jgi:8-amino-7-oxononanoate synthase